MRTGSTKPVRAARTGAARQVPPGTGLAITAVISLLIWLVIAVIARVI